MRCSYSGALVKASYSSTSRDTHLPVGAVGSVAQDKLSTETYSIHINGLKPACSPYSCELRVLDAYDDEYGGALIDPDKLPADANLFASMLRLSLSRWKIEVCFQFAEVAARHIGWFIEGI